MRPNSVPEGNLLISLDTMDPVNAEQGLALMHALLFHLRQIPEIGHAAQIEIVHLSRGTIWAQVAIIVGTAVAGAGVIQVAFDSIKTELGEGDGPLANETARTLGIYRGKNCTIVTQDQEVTINIEVMPARETVANEPPAAPEGFAYVRSGDAYVRNDDEAFVLAPQRDRAARSPSFTTRDKVFTNIPADEIVELAGQITASSGEPRFVQNNGSYGRIDSILASDQPPHDVPILAKVTATRGDQGGYADRGVKIHSWRSATDDSTAPVSSSGTTNVRPRRSAATAAGQGQALERGNAENVTLVGQLEDSLGEHSFEFLAKNGDNYLAEEADDFEDILAFGQDVLIEATLAHTEEGPLLYIHRLRIID